MTADHDLKAIIRARMEKTGESYTTARMHVVGPDREVSPPAQDLTVPDLGPVTVAVLKVNDRSARVRAIGSDEQITLRAGFIRELVPGMVAQATFRKRWTHRGFQYATGDLRDARIDIPALGLEPIPVRDYGPEDERTGREPFRSPDPYARFWRKSTAKLKPGLEFHEVTWRGSGEEETPVTDASRMIGRGEIDQGCKILEKVLCQDLRCIDAHVHLGNVAFDRSPGEALLHYEVGVRLGEHALPQDVDVFLAWGRLYNRPFLRALHGWGLSHWRLGHKREAKQIFEQILRLNPNDNQGVRYLWRDVRAGLSWEESSRHEARNDEWDLTLN
jgi:hypothetical protein